MFKKRGTREVAAFARRMLHTLCLPKNYCKPGWKCMSIEELRDALEEEYEELEKEITTLLIGQEEGMSLEDYTNLCVRISEEATDLSNICMMITDVVGGLDERV